MRIRSSRACQSCRKRKRKCDGKHPCAHCLNYDFECTYEAKVNSRLRRPQPRPVTGVPEFSAAVNAGGHDLSRPTVAGNTEQTSIGTHGVGEITSAARSLSEPFKSLFMAAYSVISFPRTVGIDLRSSVPPRLHSFVWNTGVSPEPTFFAHSRIPQIISQQESERFIETYFMVMHPLFGFLDRDQFISRFVNQWNSDSANLPFEAVLCGVVALGSLFSDSPHPFESDLVEQARVILEPSVACPPALLSLDAVTAWILRSLYLRCTTRPHISWMAICTTMHISEAVRLHQRNQKLVERFDDTHSTLRHK
jgi:hypothetical protein